MRRWLVREEICEVTGQMTEGLQPLGRTESVERLVRVLSRVVAGADFALAGPRGPLLKRCRQGC